jgi:hypothetical protein
MKDTTIEKQFFSFYDMGGLVDRCIGYVQLQYNLNPYSDKNRLADLNDKWQTYYNEKLPAAVISEYEEHKYWFDDMTLRQTSPLIDEIESNLNECKDKQEADRYIFSLLTPFEVLAGRLHPTADIERREADIGEVERQIDLWKKCPDQDRPAVATADNSSCIPSKQIQACKETIKRYRKDIERFRYVSNQFVILLCSDGINNRSMTEGTVEYVLSAMLGTFNRFANRLYAMLVTHGIDLKTYQRTAGIYLKQSWNVTDISYYIGSMKLAQHYMSLLPQEPTQVPQRPPSDRSDRQPLARHFNNTMSEAELSVRFYNLTNEGYLPADGDLQGWLWVCTGKNGTQPTEPLKWEKEQNKLYVLVEWICGNYRKTADWKTTEVCFVCKDFDTGNYVIPNTDAIKQHKISDEEEKALKNLLVSDTVRKKK